MRKIRSEVVAIDGFQNARTARPQAIEAAAQIIEHVNTIIVNCKLPPDAGDALHATVGSMLPNANALKADAGKSDTTASLHGLPHQYVSGFDDPGVIEPAN